MSDLAEPSTTTVPTVNDPPAPPPPGTFAPGQQLPVKTGTTEDVTQPTTVNDETPPADAAPTEPAPPPEPSKLERARAVADKAKRDRLRRQREADEARRARVERDQLAAQLEAERQQRQYAEEMARAAQEADPYEFLRQRGIDAKTLAERAVEESTPEGQIKALRAELDRQQRQQQQWLQQQQQREAAQRAEQARADFIAQAKDVEAYPTLARIAKRRPEALIAEGDRVMNEARARQGRYPSFDQVLAYLEYEYSKALRDERPTRDEGQRAPTTPTSPATERQPAASPGARTITARGSERAQLPKSLEEMTKEEQIAHFAKQLRDQAERTG